MREGCKREGCKRGVFQGGGVSRRECFKKRFQGRGGRIALLKQHYTVNEV
jgi:hypothetical protein